TVTQNWTAAGKDQNTVGETGTPQAKDQNTVGKAGARRDAKTAVPVRQDWTARSASPERQRATVKQPAELVESQCPSRLGLFARQTVRSKLKCPLFVANEMSAFALRAASMVTEWAVQRSRRICECLSIDPIR